MSDPLDKVLTYALLKHANDFAEYILRVAPEPSVSRAVAEAKAAIDRYTKQAVIAARIEELNKLKFHGQGSDKQTLAALYTHKLLSLKLLTAELEQAK